MEGAARHQGSSNTPSISSLRSHNNGEIIEDDDVLKLCGSQGYDLNFSAEVACCYLCLYCKLVLKEPMQTSCGHRICKPCLCLMLESGDLTCELCEEVFNLDECFRDNFAKREIMKLTVNCLKQPSGCGEVMQLNGLEDHLYKTCSFVIVRCRNGCGQLKMRYDKIHDDQCTMRTVSCNYCNEELQYTHLKEHHQTECDSYPVTCRNCCEKNIIRSKLNKHLDTCPKRPQPCSYHSIGCPFKGSADELPVHESDSSIHIAMMMEKMKVSDRSTDETQHRFAAMEEKIGQIYSAFESSKVTLARVEKRFTDLMMGVAEQVDSNANEFSKIREAIERLDKSLVMAETRMVEIEERSSNDVRNTRPSSLQGSGVQTQIMAHDQLLSMHDLRLAEHNTRFQILENTSYNGTLLWKIKDFTRRHQEAQRGDVPSLYSQPFYTSRYGYKMCARVYLNGDGMGKNSHVSLFFVIMKGEYDTLLEWPFTRRVNLTLLDQHQMKNHITDTFKPDSSSNSFQRPIREMNVASGCPLFVEKEIMRHGSYIVDDTIYVKVEVDANNTPLQ